MKQGKKISSAPLRFIFVSIKIRVEVKEKKHVYLHAQIR